MFVPVPGFITKPLFCFLCHGYISAYTINLPPFHLVIWSGKVQTTCDEAHLQLYFISVNIRCDARFPTDLNKWYCDLFPQEPFIYSPCSRWHIHYSFHIWNTLESYDLQILTFLNRDGIVQPCRIRKDGHPELVGQVLELIEDLSWQQAKPPQDEYWILIYIMSFTTL